MATYATPAIILGRHNFGEADRVLVLLTPERGIVRVVARGVRKIKSRLAGHLELFCESDLMLAEGRNLDVVTSARLIHPLPIGDDYERMRLAYLCAEMVARLSGEQEPHPGLYELVREFFAALAGGTADATAELWFKLRLLDRLGYRPELDRCVVCNTLTTAGREYALNVEKGGLVDRQCGGGLALSPNQIKLWRLMLVRPLAAVRSVATAPELVVQTLPFADAFYDYTFGKRFRSAATG